MLPLLSPGLFQWSKHCVFHTKLIMGRKFAADWNLIKANNSNLNELQQPKCLL